MKNFSLSLSICCCLGILPLATAPKKGPSTRTTETTSNSVRIIKSKPHVFVSFEREGKIDPLYVGESHKRVWLRFHNNSRWQVMFCSSPVPKEYGETEVAYDVERYEGSGETPGTRRSDDCSYLLVESGKSILFSVPREHLTEGLAVRIPFRYKWENNSDGSDNLLEPKHFVYFHSQDIPNK